MPSKALRLSVKQPTLRSIAALVLAAGALPGAPLRAAQLPATRADVTRDTAPVRELCKLVGARYVGKTAQGLGVCLTLSRDRKKVLEFGFEYRSTCTAGYSIPPGKLVVRKPSAVKRGKFQALGVGGTTFVISGSVDRKQAAGSLNVTNYSNIVTSNFQPVECHTGAMRWTAQLTL